MSENNADAGGKPSDRIIKLYETWGKGGAGVLISGNVMVDARALGEEHNVVIEDEKYLPELTRWATEMSKAWVAFMDANQSSWQASTKF